MTLKEKYAKVGELGVALAVADGWFDEAGGKLKVGGKAAYQYDKDRIWDLIKTHEGWEKEVVADITVVNKDAYGIYEIKSGDTLGAIAKQYFGNAGKYPLIAEANKELIKDPNKIQVGWKIKLPWREGEAPK